LLLNGESSRGLTKSRIVSTDRCVAKVFGEAVGNAPSARGHVNCVEILKVEDARVSAVPKLIAVGDRARLAREAAIEPTYFFRVIKAFRGASVEPGISKVEAEVAVAQTMIGAAEFVLKTGRRPEDPSLMISTRTINESAIENLFTEALMDAFAKIGRLETKLNPMSYSVNT
jgi:hypothetical protein